MEELAILLMSAAFAAEAHQLLEKSGKEQFSKEEVRDILTEAGVTLLENFMKSKEEKEAKQSVEEKSAEELINEGLDKLHKK